jgi:hypothetical protein
MYGFSKRLDNSTIHDAIHAITPEQAKRLHNEVRSGAIDVVKEVYGDEDL